MILTTSLLHFHLSLPLSLPPSLPPPSCPFSTLSLFLSAITFVTSLLPPSPPPPHPPSPLLPLPLLAPPLPLGSEGGVGGWLERTGIIFLITGGPACRVIIVWMQGG